MNCVCDSEALQCWSIILWAIRRICFAFFFSIPLFLVDFKKKFYDVQLRVKWIRTPVSIHVKFFSSKQLKEVLVSRVVLTCNLYDIRCHMFNIVDKEFVIKKKFSEAPRFHPSFIHNLGVAASTSSVGWMLLKELFK